MDTRVVGSCEAYKAGAFPVRIGRRKFEQPELGRRAILDTDMGILPRDMLPERPGKEARGLCPILPVNEGVDGSPRWDM